MSSKDLHSSCIVVNATVLGDVDTLCASLLVSGELPKLANATLTLRRLYILEYLLHFYHTYNERLNQLTSKLSQSNIDVMIKTEASDDDTDNYQEENDDSENNDGEENNKQEESNDANIITETISFIQQGPDHSRKGRGKRSSEGESPGNASKRQKQSSSKAQNVEDGSDASPSHLYTFVNTPQYSSNLQISSISPAVKNENLEKKAQDLISLLNPSIIQQMKKYQHQTPIPNVSEEVDDTEVPKSDVSKSSEEPDTSLNTTLDSEQGLTSLHTESEWDISVTEENHSIDATKPEESVDLQNTTKGPESNISDKDSKIAKQVKTKLKRQRKQTKQPKDPSDPEFRLTARNPKTVATQRRRRLTQKQQNKILAQQMLQAQAEEAGLLSGPDHFLILPHLQQIHQLHKLKKLKKQGWKPAPDIEAKLPDLNSLGDISKFCLTCGKSFATSHGLKDHQASMHGQNVRFTCDVCQKGFYEKKHFENHVDSHSGVRNFTCEFCDKKFRSAHNKNVHLKTCKAKLGIKEDPSKKPFVCPICSSRMAERKYLRDHMRICHDNVVEFSCVCGKMYPWRASRLKHQKKCQIYQDSQRGIRDNLQT